MKKKLSATEKQRIAKEYEAKARAMVEEALRVNPEIFNDLFVSKSDEPDGLERAHFVANDFVQERLRELSFERPIGPPRLPRRKKR